MAAPEAPLGLVAVLVRRMVMPNVNRSAVQARDALVIAGIEKHLMNVPNIVLAGTTYTPTELIQVVQSRIDSANTIAGLKAKWHDAVQAHVVLSKEVTRAVRGLRYHVLNLVGDAAEPLADYGFAPPKKAKSDPKKKVSAANKLRATRKARHTMGPKAKKAITGQVAPEAQGQSNGASNGAHSNGSAPHTVA